MLSLFVMRLFVNVKNIVLVIYIAVNIEHNIPVLNVIANPFIGPEPIHANTNAAINVVTFASIIVMNACE